jgi:SH3-like domain-containing protein
MTFSFTPCSTVRSGFLLLIVLPIAAFLLPAFCAAAPYISEATPLPDERSWEMQAGVAVPDNPNGLPRTDTVKVSLGNIRTAPTTASRTIRQVTRSQPLMLLYLRDGWYRVELPDGALGWAHRTLFAPSPGDNAKESAAGAGELDVVVYKGNIREAPGMKAAVIAHVEKDERVSLLETRKAWYRVRLPDGGEGWGHRSLFRRREGTKAPSSTGSRAGQATGEAWPAVDEKDAEGHRIKFIRVDVARQGEERVLFLLDGFFPPQTFVLEEGALRVVCDFPNTGLAPGIGRLIPVEGRLIRQIRTSQYRGDHPKVRAVLDLAPDKDYEVNQFFFQEQNVYSVVVREK